MLKIGPIVGGAVAGIILVVVLVGLVYVRKMKGLFQQIYSSIAFAIMYLVRQLYI